MESLSPKVVSAAKLPILNPNEFDLWKIRIEQYFHMTDYSLWEVIFNGDSLVPTRVIEGVVQPIAPTTAEQRLARKNKLKARGTLLMALLDKHQLKFNIHKDAKTLMEAIKKRFGGNKETKKKLISQLEILRESLSQEDINLKLLRSLPTEWRTHTLIWRNKTDLEEHSIEDLFNSLKIYKAEVKSSSSASTFTQNIAYVSSQNTDSIAEPVSAVASVSTASVKIPVFALPNVDTLKEIDLKWQMAMLTMSARRILQRTGRNLGANGPNSTGFDMSKVECYNCHRKGHFARECRSPKDTRRNVIAEPQKRNVLVETSTSNVLVSQYHSGERYHAVPSPYTGIFMPPKPDLVFHDTPNDNETVHTAFNVELSPTKPDKEPSVKPVENSILAANHKTTIPKPKSHGNIMNRKACFVCKSLTHLIKDYDYYEKKMAQTPAKNHAQTGNHRHYARMTLPNPQRHVVPTAVLTKSKLVPLITARQVTTAVSPTNVTRPRPAKTLITKPHSPPRRHITHSPSPKASTFPPKVTAAKAPMGNPQHALKNKGVIDSRCSRHMTGNMSYLSEFEEINGGYVAFGGNSKGSKISGKGKIRTGKLDFDDVYFVKELKFNLISVSHMCDKKNSVLFIDSECIVLSPEFKLLDENQVLLRVPRENNINNVDLKNIVPSGDLTCLFAKATLNESDLWHRRLGHINFKTINTLVKGNLVRGLPSKVFENNHTCVACKKRKQHRASCKTKPVSSVSQPLQRNLSAEFEDFSVNNINEVNPGDSLVLAVRQISTNSTNTFSAAGPSNTIVSPTYGKSSYVDTSQFLDDPNMPELEDITYSDDELSFYSNKEYDKVAKDQGFKKPDYPNKVYKVVKALYRLHQAPRAWYETLANYLMENCFQRRKIDQTLFIKKQKDDVLLVQVYVDDIIFGSTNKDLCKAYEKLMKDKFQMSSMGELIFFLGLQVKQKQDGIFISQDKYVAEILRKFGLIDGKSASTPIDTKKALLKDPDGEDVDVYTYRSMICSLMYLTSSRLDIMFVVCACAHFQVTPKVSHLHEVKRIFRYLKGKPHLGLWYPKDSPFNLIAYSDSDYASATLDRKSTTGGVNSLDAD
nr:uncharacterized mitochondrial protein AtMg00810-like [Tanacetum cinerariifolium]